MKLVAVIIFQALAAGAQRQRPVRTHLRIVIKDFHRFIVEGVFRGGALAGPDHRFMGVGETPSAEIRHRIGFAPDHVVENPVAQVLQDGADAEDIVIGADHPQRPVGLQGAAAFGEPCPGEFIIGGKARKLVPMVVNRVDLALVGPRQVAGKLQVVRRIGEDQVN